MDVLSNRQKQIIDVSIKIISERGFQELTLKNLAGEIGISEPAIYRHFDSKQKILITILESFQHQNKLINDNILNENETAFKQLMNSITTIMNKFHTNPAMSAVIFSEEIFQNQSELSEMVLNIMNTTIDFFTNLINKGQNDRSIRNDIDKEDLTTLVMGSIRQIITVWRLSGFKYDLKKSGIKLVNSLEVMIAA